MRVRMGAKTFGPLNGRVSLHKVTLASGRTTTGQILAGRAGHVLISRGKTLFHLSIENIGSL